MCEQSATEKLAEEFHNEFCQSNHTDVCDWCYRTWEDFHKNRATYKFSTRGRYYARAERMIRWLATHRLGTPNELVEFIQQTL